MLKDRENDLVGGSERSLHAGAAELQQRIIFVKVPGQASADIDGALETLVRGRLYRLRIRGFFRGQVRIENEQNTADVFAREFRDHQGTGAGGSFTINWARTVRRGVAAQW